MRREWGQTDGVIGTLQSKRYHCNTPQECRWATLEMAGPRSLVSCNRNTVMRDVGELTREGSGKSTRSETQTQGETARGKEG